MSLNVKFSNQVWAIIPARSGSKRLKNKNLLKVGKISLVGHAIKIAKNTKGINRIFVSTDSTKIKNESSHSNITGEFFEYFSSVFLCELG